MKKTAQNSGFPFEFLSKPVQKAEEVVEDVVETVEDFDKQVEDDEVLVTIPDEYELVDNEGEVVEEDEVENGVKEYVFKLQEVPGAESETDDEDEPVEEEKVVTETQKEIDDWNWEHHGVGKFLDWLEQRFKSIPAHSGKDTTGIERALAYFKRLDGEISRAMSKDYKREIDAAKAEEARSEIVNGMERLLDRLEKLNSKKFKKSKKKAELETELVKKASPVNGGQVTSVPYLISNIARACINAAIKSGKDIEDIFSKLAKEYSLDKREKFQVAMLIRDMGFPMLVDRVNYGEDIVPTTGPSEFITNYPN